MMIAARSLHTGDVLHRPNWDEHVVRAWPDERGVAVVTREFPDWVQHFPLDTRFEVDEAAS